jgi:hypothetical protein
MRVQGDQLSSFMHSYISQKNKRDLFKDREFIQALSKLSAIVGQRDSTVLLAKLYADHMIAMKEHLTTSELPENVPELMLSYLNAVNRNAKGNDFDDRTVHKAAKIISWNCLREGFQPKAADMTSVIDALTDGHMEPQVVLDYLEERLHLIQTLGPARDRIKFVLDPLAEYLAALYLRDTWQRQRTVWDEFEPEAIKITANLQVTSFLVAIDDCWSAARMEVPRFVIEKISAASTASSAGTIDSEPTYRRQEEELTKRTMDQ